MRKREPYLSNAQAKHGQKGQHGQNGQGVLKGHTGRMVEKALAVRWLGYLPRGGTNAGFEAVIQNVTAFSDESKRYGDMKT